MNLPVLGIVIVTYRKIDRVRVYIPEIGSLICTFDPLSQDYKSAHICDRRASPKSVVQLAWMELYVTHAVKNIDLLSVVLNIL